MNKKIGRNDPCHCGSGKKYKFCHFGDDKQRIVKTDLTCDVCNNNIDIDLSNHYISKLQPSDIPLRMFCKENDFYMFGAMSLYQGLELLKKLDNNTLTKKDFYDAYYEFFTKERCTDSFATYCQDIEEFRSLQEILFDTVEAHYNNKFTLSIPVFFLLIEGILRELSGIADNDNMQPKFNRDIWNARLLFNMEDSVGFLNGYINSLFEGGKPSEVFSRNTVLHGINKKYYTKENSWSLLLLLNEIGHLKKLEKQTAPFDFEKSTKGIKIIPPDYPN